MRVGTWTFDLRTRARMKSSSDGMLGADLVWWGGVLGGDGGRRESVVSHVITAAAAAARC